MLHRFVPFKRAAQRRGDRRDVLARDAMRETAAQHSLESLEQRLLLSTTPTLAPLVDVTLRSGSPLHIALDGFDADGDAITYSATSTNGNVEALIPQGNRSILFSVAEHGDMIVEAFEGRVPLAAGRMLQLAQSGYYDGLTIHRVIENFMIQGGSINGDGQSDPNGSIWDDQFHPDLQHNAAGMASLAKGVDDTNGGQFFFTAAPTASLRNLDFNHSVFGFITEGDGVRQSIATVDVVNNGNGEISQPTDPIVITKATVFFDRENGTLMIKAPENYTGTTTITVRATDSNGDFVEQTFEVTVVKDNVNARPYLKPVPAIHTTVDTPVQYQLEAVDVEGDSVFFGTDTPGVLQYSVDSGTGMLTITPTGGQVGTFTMFVGVRKPSGGDWDTQSVSVQINRPDININDSTNLGTESIASVNSHFIRKTSGNKPKKKATRFVYIQNVGTVPLRITKIKTVGKKFSTNIKTNRGGVPLKKMLVGPGAQRGVKVFFQPGNTTRPKNYYSRLIVNSTDSDEVVSRVSLKGTVGKTPPPAPAALALLSIAPSADADKSADSSENNVASRVLSE